MIRLWMFPNILVGKVIDVNHDEKTVLMDEMEETDESYTYKMKIGITYKESIEAVVHPMIVYMMRTVTLIIFKHVSTKYLRQS